MKPIIGLLLSSSLSLPGCAVIRAADDSVSGVLETIPLLRMVGIESRKQPEAPAVNTGGTAVSPTTAEQGTKKPSSAQTPLMGNALPGARADSLGLIPSERLLVLWLGAASWVNPNPMARPSPVRVVIFELQDAGKFREASASALLTDVAKVLGPDVRRQHELILAPGETVSLAWPVRQSGYLGVLADFRTQPDAPKQDRQVIALGGDGHSAWRVRLSGNTLIAAPDRAVAVASNDPLNGLSPAAEMGPVVLRLADGLALPTRPAERPEAATLPR